MSRKVDWPTLAVALVGLVGSAGMVGFGWYGIQLLMLQGPPVRRELWPPYLWLLAGIVVSSALMYVCFRLLDRWGVRPPDEEL